jgi:hypothetical protein
MPLSWNEIRKNSYEFIKEWEGETSERAEYAPFWEQFFQVFGITRRRVALYQEPVKKLSGETGFIDLIWKGKLLVEHKSKGKDLTTAFNQASDYTLGLKEEEFPKFILVTDFEKFRLYDLEEHKTHEFVLKQLPERLHLFGFLIEGFNKKSYGDELPVNIKAAELLGELHDELKKNGYEGHPLEVFLVRILFCLFADNTMIFEKSAFTQYIDTKTKEDGSDLGSCLSHIFQVLDTAENTRQKNLDEDLKLFRYINGSLFKEPLPIPDFDKKSRTILLKCCYFDWSAVSPAVFGSLFQAVMDPVARRNIGAHYTTETNILKTIRPLFLDSYRKELESSFNSRPRLRDLLEKIKGLKFLDPACGCGNFLVIAYRELRQIELEAHLRISKIDGRDFQKELLSLDKFRGIDVDSMHGIEIEEFPVRIAEVALWLMDHTMNMKLSESFGVHYARLPLRTSPKIVNKNALRMDWNEVIERKDVTFVLGNPPFKGKHLRSPSQEMDMELVCRHIKNFKSLDYVCAWYVKATEYLKGTNIRVGFVSTNSITQGEQVGILWSFLGPNGAVINFAHRTFAWNSEARGKAHVYVVIIGFSFSDYSPKYIYDYEDIKGEPHERVVSSISPYLVPGSNLVATSRGEPLCAVPEMLYGNKPADGGFLTFFDEEKREMIKEDPRSKDFIKPFIGDKEFLHSTSRWCLWLKDANPKDWHDIKPIRNRVNSVKDFRASSKKEGTRDNAETPYLFTEIRQPKSQFILIPLHSSENRSYIPMDYCKSSVILGNSCSAVIDAKLYHFSVLNSAMHMAWVRQVCGRIKSDYRYSNNIVYNNFPWPAEPNKEKMKEIEEAVNEIFEARDKYKGASLAQLYDPETMPKDLLVAHQKNDRLVDRLYRPQPFTSELNRLEFLFDLYAKLIDPLLAPGNKKRK